MENTLKTSEAQRNATKKYLSKFTELKLRLTSEEYASLKEHTSRTGESIAAFMRRAIKETIKHDNI